MTKTLIILKYFKRIINKRKVNNINKQIIDDGYIFRYSGHVHTGVLRIYDNKTKKYCRGG